MGGYCKSLKLVGGPNNVMTKAKCLALARKESNGSQVHEENSQDIRQADPGRPSVPASELGSAHQPDPGFCL